MRVDIEEIKKVKKLALVAMFSDDRLMDMLVLKGGNAIEFAYGLESRYSADLDFSLESDLQELSIEEFRARVEKVLKEQFVEHDYAVFDVTISERPPEISEDMKEFWGGYKIEFKVIDEDSYERYQSNLANLRRRSRPVTPAGGRKFQIDISKHEYCDTKGQVELDGYTVYVYTPSMIIAEKLRAICQQMEEYGHIVKSSSQTPRGRDFFDIYLLATRLKIDMAAPDNTELIRRIFEAKRVPLRLLGQIRNQRDYHERDFQVVAEAIPPSMASYGFNYYFTFVVDLCKRLEALWIK